MNNQKKKKNSYILLILLFLVVAVVCVDVALIYVRGGFSPDTAEAPEEAPVTETEPERGEETADVEQETTEVEEETSSEDPSSMAESPEDRFPTVTDPDDPFYGISPEDIIAIEIPDEEPGTETEVQGKYSPLYCTVWPIKDLKVYSDTNKKTVLSTAKALTMFCVLEENTSKSLFKVRTDFNTFGYIDSNYCMINLPDYLGDLCSYDITNSYNSLYTVHEYEIHGVTGKVIEGYENVRLADGSFLVPYLYPCTPKLISAAEAALAQGYRIKIYDSYRPKEATSQIYTIATGVMDRRLPSETWTGREVQLPSSGRLNYIDLVELWGWDLGSFLAPGASMHNKGIALDLTFEDAVTGEELTAQTMMHDLSAYSTIRRNNDTAARIYKILEAAKLHNIVSEWWHFQDNETQSKYSPPFCSGGVCAEGWMADENGERYRLADGSYLVNAMLVLDGEDLVFDDNGYLVP